MIRGHAERRPRKEIVYEWDLRFITQFARVALRHDPFRSLVQHDAMLSHKKNARQFVGHDDDRDSKVTTEGQD